MNAHILIFKCPTCGRPLPFVRLDGAKVYPSTETASLDPNTVTLECLGCQWTGKLLVFAYEKSWTIDWPHLKDSNGRKTDTSPSR